MSNLACKGQTWRFCAGSGGIVNTAEVTLKAGVAGKVNVLTELEIVNANATGTEVVIKDGAGGTVIYRTYAVQAIGPIHIQFEKALAATAGNALVAACITTASQTYINARGTTL